MKFCDNCDEKLNQIFSYGKLTLKCENCKKEYEPEPQDTLLYEESEQSAKDINNYLKNIEFDNASLKFIDYCIYCKDSRLIFEVFTKPNMIFIYKCATCKNIWTTLKS